MTGLDLDGVLPLVQRLREHDRHAVHDHDDDCEEAVARIEELEADNMKLRDLCARAICMLRADYAEIMIKELDAL